MDLNILCVKWGTKFSSDYVNRLYNMVERNLTLPHTFVCLTDDTSGLSQGIEALPFQQSDLEYCWNKLLLFDTLPLEGVGLFFDLDVVVTGNIDCLLTHAPEKKFCGIFDWNRPQNPQFNASVMRYRINEHKYVIDNFRNDVASGKLVKKREWDAYLKSQDKVVYWDGSFRYGGDQEWTSRQVVDSPQSVKANAFPNEWILSYKKHGKKGLPNDCRVMVFHGDPKPHEVSHPWVLEHWR